MEKMDELLEKYNSLIYELNEVKRQIEDAQIQQYHHVSSKEHIVQRYMDGDTVIVSLGRHWWVNKNGDLICCVDDGDISRLKELTESGFFDKITL